MSRAGEQLAMSQPRYLICYRWGRTVRAVEQTDTPRPFHPDVTKEGEPLMGIPCRVSTGEKQRGFISHFGIRQPFSTKVPATAEGVKGLIRELRPQEAAGLDALDAEIEALSQQLRAKREERKARLREAFAKGHVVRLAEVLGWIK